MRPNNEENRFPFSPNRRRCFYGNPEFNKTKLIAPLIALVVGLLTACGAATSAPSPTPPPLASQITLYDWIGDDVPPVMDAFEKEYGIKVNFIPFDSQEEAVTNLKAGKVYDMVVIEHDFLPELLTENLLAEINYSHVPNFKNIRPSFRDLNHDPDNLHSVPFTWGSTFIIYRTDLVSTPITHWADLWKLGKDSKIAVRDSAREPLGMVLRTLGYSINTDDPAQLAKAKQKLMQIKDNLVVVGSSAPEAMPLLLNGEVTALIGWSGDVGFIETETAPITYVFPKEGLMLWGDNFVIPANSPNKATAELFLNFLMRPEINAAIVNYTYYATANEAAQEFIDPEIRDNPAIFPPLNSLKNAEVFLPLSKETNQIYNQIWEDLKDEAQ
jgi:spermidine/putrescine transport system substrate-binding protein